MPDVLDSPDDSRRSVAREIGEYGVPVVRETDAEGREILVYGERGRLAEFAHAPVNRFGVRGTAGLVQAEMILRAHGRAISEGDLVDQAVAEGLCQMTGEAAIDGGVAARDLAGLLNHHGLVAELEQAHSLEDLALEVEAEGEALLGVNPGYLATAHAAELLGMGCATHPASATAVVRDAGSGEIRGFYLQVAGRPQPHFIDADGLNRAWLMPSGRWVSVAVR